MGPVAFGCNAVLRSLATLQPGVSFSMARALPPRTPNGVAASLCYKEICPPFFRQGAIAGALRESNRFALLVDGADYYTALAKAIRRAKRWIALLAWDLDTRTQLVEHDPGQRTGPLQQFFRDIASRITRTCRSQFFRGTSRYSSPTFAIRSS